MGGTVKVHLFATAREAVGRPTLTWSVPATGIPARALVRELVDAYPALGPIVRHSRLVRNAEYVRNSGESVRPGDEFAIHPPYSGG